MATITPSLALKTTILQAINDALNGGSDAAVIQIYTGVKPSGPDVAITTQVLLGTLTGSDPAGTVATLAGVPTLTFGVVTQDADADATGTATWARLSAKSGATLVPVLDIDITAVGGGGFGQMNTTSIIIHGPITAPSIVITA